MSKGQSERIFALREKLKKAEMYTYVWYTIACELAGKEAVDAAFQRILTEGLDVRSPGKHEPVPEGELWR